MAKLTGPREIVEATYRDEDRAAALNLSEQMGAEDRERANADLRRLILSPSAEEKAKLHPLPERLREYLWPLPWRLGDVREILGVPFFWSALCATSMSTLTNLMKNPHVFRKPKMTAEAVAGLSDLDAERLLADETADYELSRLARAELENLFGGGGAVSLKRFSDDRIFREVERLVREKQISKAKAYAEVADARKTTPAAIKQAYHRVIRRPPALE